MDIRKFFFKNASPTSTQEDTGQLSPSYSETSSSSTSATLAANLPPLKPMTTPRTATMPPSDLSERGDDIKQVILKMYPMHNGRSFRSEWFKKFKWLEYSAQNDAAFCYACRQFQPFVKEKTYTETGYKNWKNALDSRNGFPKHETTEHHIISMKMWEEKLHRQQTSSSVSTLINKNVLEKHRYYIKSIAEVVQFLAVNELALRGTYDVEEHIERSLFNNLFRFTLKKDSVLSECTKHIPKNVSYTSPEIQNEIIEILTDIVRESVIADIKNADVPWFTLMEDGTRDKNNRENISIAIRYVKDGKAFESLLGIFTIEKLDARSFASMTLDILSKNGLDSSCLLSQCYDGASVMSGKKGGVAAIIQQELERNIPYIHCANHRLHLIVVKMVSDVTVIKHFFDQCVLLHTFFQHAKVSAIYKGKSIVRVLEQRWSGHLAIVDVIFSNYKEIIRTLDVIIKGEIKFNGEDIAKCIGLKTVMSGKEFRFSLVLMRKVLHILEPADAVLQARSTSLKDALGVLKTVKASFVKLRDDDGDAIFLEVLKESDALLDNNGATAATRPNKRKLMVSTSMEDYVIFQKLPSASSSTSTDDNSFQKQTYVEVLDLVIMQFDERFCDNEELLNSISSIEEFNHEKLEFLQTLGLRLPSKEELYVVKEFFKEKPNINKFEELYRFREAFKTTYELFATVATFGCSTACCESSFSTVTAINRPQRRSMTHQRMADLVYLAFEKKRTEEIDFDKFLQKFNTKCRRLQLF